MVPCPRCGETLDLDQGWCLHCRSERLRWLTVMLKFSGAGLLVVLALGVWQRHAIKAAWNEFTAQIDHTRNPRFRGVNDGTAAPPMAPSPVAAPVAASTFVFIAGLSDPPPAQAESPPETGTPKPPEDTGPAAPPPEPRPADTDTRRFYGVVYDALTLKPVEGAKLIFHLRGDENGWSATTNARGHYQVDLFNSTIEKLSVSVKAPAGYREGLIEDKDPPVRERALSARRKIVAEATPDELEPVPLRVVGDPRIVPLDLVLLPEVPKR